MSCTGELNRSVGSEPCPAVVWRHSCEGGGGVSVGCWGRSGDRASVGSAATMSRT